MVSGIYQLLIAHTQEGKVCTRDACDPSSSFRRLVTCDHIATCTAWVECTFVIEATGYDPIAISVSVITASIIGSRGRVGV